VHYKFKEDCKDRTRATMLKQQAYLKRIRLHKVEIVLMAQRERERERERETLSLTQSVVRSLDSCLPFSFLSIRIQ
jgi:hypothetical protein